MYLLLLYCKLIVMLLCMHECNFLGQIRAIAKLKSRMPRAHRSSNMSLSWPLNETSEFRTEHENMLY